jgi:DNA polymerase I
MPSRLDPEKTVYLVDGTSNLFRAFYAIRGLSTAQGLPTNAVYGFTAMLRKLLREHRPGYVAVAFDRPEPTFRHQAFADYKANRAEAPEALIAQIPYVKRVCQALHVPMVERAGYEADDLIGTLARQAREAGYRVVIVASDKDLLQLVAEGVQVYNPVKEEFLDAAGVERVFGVPPARVRDVLALSGDASDNIPGVPGIGEKGARDLVRRFGDLDAVLSNAGSVERKSYREGLLAHADTARLSRDLATICSEAPIPFEPERLRLRPPDAAAARALFLELQFDSLAREFEDPVQPSRADSTILLDADALREAVRRLADETTLAINLERDHAEPMRARLVGLTLAAPQAGAFYIPIAHHRLGAPVQIDAGVALETIRPLLESTHLERIGHHIKSDLILWRRLGIDPPAYALDTMIASYVLNPSRRSHTLEVVAEDLAGLRVPGYATLLGSGAKEVPLSDLEIERAAPLVCARAMAMLALRDRLREALRTDGLLSLYTDLEMPLAGVLAEMEAAGVRIDVDFLNDLSRRWDRDLTRLVAEIHRLAGQEFNVNSPRQLGEVLFEKLQLRPGRKTRKTRSFSTSMEVLDDLAESHPLPRAVLEYRSLQKLKSTYVDTLPKLANPDTGRVHTSFNQTVAATGRLSSSDPNLQNIPVRTEQGRQIRRAFIPADGCLLLSADYSQIELRVLAHLSGDTELQDAFRKNEDIHRRTAAGVFGVLPDLVTEEMRRRAKAVNFGIIYGMGPQRLAREQGITLREASEFIAHYFDRFPRVKSYLDATIAAAEREGKVRTLFGRVRYLPEILQSDRGARQQAVRAAVNTTIQGTAADLIKEAMVVLAGRLRKTRAASRMTLQVHDELVLEVPRDELAAAGHLVREVMEGVHGLSVPLVADLRVGPNWLETEPVPRSKN